MAAGGFCCRLERSNVMFVFPLHVLSVFKRDKFQASKRGHKEAEKTERQVVELFLEKKER